MIIPGPCTEFFQYSEDARDRNTAYVDVSLDTIGKQGVNESTYVLLHDKHPVDRREMKSINGPYQGNRDTLAISAPVMPSQECMLEYIYRARSVSSNRCAVIEQQSRWPAENSFRRRNLGCQLNTVGSLSGLLVLTIFKSSRSTLKVRAMQSTRSSTFFWFSKRS